MSTTVCLSVRSPPGSRSRGLPSSGGPSATGPAGQSMQDRSSRPHRSPTRTPQRVVRRCVSLRLRLREGPVQLAARLGIAPSTVTRILTSCGLNRLAHVDNRLSACERATGQPVRRYEHDHRLTDPRRRQEDRQHPRRRRLALRRAPTGHTQPRRHHQQPQRQTPRDRPGLRVRAPAHRRPLTRGLQRGPRRRDGSHRHSRAGAGRGMPRRPGRAHRAGPVRQRAGLQVTPVARAVPPAPHHGEQDTALPATQGGKIERFHRTLADGWAYARCHTSEQERRDALPGRIHHYNHHRPHQACNGKPPITRLTNLPDQYGLEKSVCSM